MRNELVRITLEEGTEFTVEYGKKQLPGLTPEEEKEVEQLNKELIEYSDFTAAEALEDEARQQLMEKKKRLEELAEKKKQEHVDWYPIEDIETLLIICRPTHRHTYVENLPVDLIKKLTEPQMTFHFGDWKPDLQFSLPCPLIEQCTSRVRGSKCGSIAHKDCEEFIRMTKARARIQDDPGALEGRTQKEQDVIYVVSGANSSWDDYVTIEEKNGIVFITPKKFLGQIWGPINTALKESYGDIWISKGTGDKDAHWEAKL